MTLRFPAAAPASGATVRAPGVLVSPPVTWSGRIAVSALLLFAFLSLILGLAILLAHLLPSSGQLAYYSNRDGDMNIYLADVGSGREFQLTRHPADDLSPAWSPDGQQMAFISYRDNNYEIYVMDALGRGLRRLTENTYNDTNPVWSPDGRYIAFESYRGMTQDIFLLDMTTGSEQRVSGRTGSYNMKPDWSPDSQHVAYYADDFRDPELYLLSLSSAALRPLTNNDVNDWDPAWSPDGRWVVFYSNANVNFDLFAFDVTTGETHQLTYHLARDWLPVWSPDGRFLAFVSERTGRPALFVLDAACLDVPVTCADSAYELPGTAIGNEIAAWSPDSLRLAYVSPRDGNLEIYIVNVACALHPATCDANAHVRLTHNNERDRGPTWRPFHP